MNRKMIRLLIVGLLILAVMIMTGCAKEETTVPTTPAPPETLETPTTPETPETPALQPRYLPVARISATPSTAKFGESIAFSGAASTDSDGSITSYQWDFGNGDTASGETVAYTYSDRGGEHVVKLKVSDNDGFRDTAEVSVKVVLGSKIKDSQIKIEATVSSWREGKQPYDIYGAIKQKLEKAGFEVVPQESTDYDAILLVDYEEGKGIPYTSVVPLTLTVCCGTDITCDLTLDDKAGNRMFETIIFGHTPYVASEGELYSSAVDDFEDDGYFKYLGEIIAHKFGVEDATVVKSVVQALKNRDEDVRMGAAKALVEIGDATAVEPLIQALKDEDVSVRWYAAEALGEIGDARAVEPLIQALKDKGVSVRRYAAEALGKIGDARAVEPLIQALKDEDASVRYYAAEALGNIGDARAVEPLVQALKDEASFVRSNAAEALGKIGDARAVEPLIQALKDEDWLVRSRAANALGEIRDARAVEPLIRALGDEDSNVRSGAKLALKKIRGY